MIVSDRFTNCVATPAWSVWAGGVAELLDSPSIKTSSPTIGVRSIATRTATFNISDDGVDVGVGVST